MFDLRCYIILICTLALSHNSVAQSNDIGISIVPSIHFPHDGVLGDFHPGAGAYIRAHSFEKNLFVEIGYVKFQPRQAIYESKHKTDPYTISYSNYSAVPINGGFIYNLSKGEKNFFYLGGYGGLWYTFYDYKYTDPIGQQEGVTGFSKVQMGFLMMYERRIKKLHLGAEIRYGGLFPISFGWHHSKYEGLVILSLKSSYYF